MSASLVNELDHLAPGRTVFVPGATGEIVGLAKALVANPEAAAGVRFVGCFVPGMNELDYASLHPDARLTTFMLPGAMRESFSAGKVDLVPHGYFAAAKTLAGIDYDIAFAHVAPPDADGQCSLGIASDFAPLAWPRAVRKILVINPAMPAMPRGPRLRMADADAVIEAEMPLMTGPAAQAPSGVSDTIARSVANLVPDGASIQTGIGGAPGAAWAHLTGHRDLVLKSGMANDWLRNLAEAGALAESGHHAGIAYGTEDLYHWLASTDTVAFKTTLETHNPSEVERIERFHAINSALEVDLFGQVNVEWQSGRINSGVGGGGNFVRAALASRGGRAITALPATARKGAISRIVPQLSAPAVGLARSDADTVVTEYGVAEIRNLGLDRRAEALIAIAAPEFREDLQRAWSAMRKTF